MVCALFLSVAAFWTVIHGATESPAEAGHNVAETATADTIAMGFAVNLMDRGRVRPHSRGRGEAVS